MRPLALVLAGVCVAVTVSLLGGPAAQAADDGRLMLVLDSSGSMAEASSGGGTKIDAAKAALGEVVDGLPRDAQVGLRIYGSEVFSADDPGACTDSERVVDLGTGNRSELRAAIRSYTPYGETPIGYALQQAGADLGDEGARSIVLVSDGEPTCEPDPCEVAAELAEDGVDLTIDVVGLDVDGAAREALSCIADAGGGTYYDADDAASLGEALDLLATRAVQPYAVTGTPVEGTPTPADAPALAAGDFTDTIGASSSRAATNYYALSPSTPDATLHVSATLVSTRGGADAVDLEVLPADGDEAGSCAQANDSRVGLTGYAVLSAAAVVDTAEAPDGCAEDLLVRVTRSVGDQQSYGGDRASPLELRVVEEPPVTSTEDLPTYDGEAVLGGFLAGRARDVRPGTSFAAAPTVEPGSYAGTIVPGEAQVVLVDADWGQQVQARVRLRAGGELGEETGSNELFGTLEVLSPDRAPAGLAGAASTRDGTALTAIGYLDGTTGATFENMTAPVAWTNRQDSFVDGASAASLAGSYAVVVTLSEPAGLSGEAQRVEVPFTLDVGVEGRPDGEPAYVEPEPEPTPDGATDGATDGAPSGPSTATPSDPTTDTSSDVAAASSDDGGGDALPVGLLAVGVVALLAAAVVALRARRSAGRG